MKSRKLRSSLTGQPTSTRSAAQYSTSSNTRLQRAWDVVRPLMIGCICAIGGRLRTNGQTSTCLSRTPAGAMIDRREPLCAQMSVSRINATVACQWTTSHAYFSLVRFNVRVVPARDSWLQTQHSCCGTGSFNYMQRLAFLLRHASH